MKDKSSFIMLVLVVFLVVLSAVSTFVTLSSGNMAPVDKEPVVSGKIGVSVKEPVVVTGRVGVMIKESSNERGEEV